MASNKMEALNLSKKLAKEAGKLVIEIYKSDFVVKQKRDKSPVTEADLAADKLIINGIEARFPRHGILTEESSDDKVRLEKDYVWIIDPIDGTREFVARNGEFSVNIALSFKGEPIVGAVYVPVTGDLYFASKGDGAYVERRGITRRIHVSNRLDTNKMIVTKSRSHSGIATDRFIRSGDFKVVRTLGSSIKGCLIASGEADVYFREHAVKEWDVCAMDCVIREAGGKLTDLNGNVFVYNKKKPTISTSVTSNNAIHDKLLTLVKEVLNKTTGNSNHR